MQNDKPEYVYRNNLVLKWCDRRNCYVSADPVSDLQARLCWLRAIGRAA